MVNGHRPPRTACLNAFELSMVRRFVHVLPWWHCCTTAMVLSETGWQLGSTLINAVHCLPGRLGWSLCQ